MKFKCAIGTGPSDRNWSGSNNGNTLVSDGFCSSETNFGNRASVKKIIKSYLKSYYITPDEAGNYGGSFEIRIDRRPGSNSPERFDVAVSADGNWATVTA
jgi:hypothetical protein